MNKMFNFKFGPIEDAFVRLSPYGLSVQNDTGTYVAYDKTQKKIIDVDVLNFSLSKMAYRMPVAIKSVSVGDVIIHSGVIMIVTEVPEDGKSLIVVDITCGELKQILPVASPFGFDFITKIVTLIDITNLGANANSPFGNLLPLMLMGGDDGEFDMKNFAMMSMLSGGGIGGAMDMSNPMMMMALMGGDGNNNMMPLLMMNMMNGAKLAPAAE